MFLIVGLGNPGDEYTETRHNAGFMAIDALAERHGARYWKSQGSAVAAETRIGGTEVVLAKPQTFMNLSGNAVAHLLSGYGLKVSDLIIIHDELDLGPGVVRCKLGGGHAGHNGLRSIHQKVGTDEYVRVRIGVGRPPGRMAAADYVLQALRKEGLIDLEVSAQVAADACELIVTDGIAAAMNRFNEKPTS